MPSTMKNFIHVGKSEIVKYIFVDLPQYLLNFRWDEVVVTKAQFSLYTLTVQNDESATKPSE